MKTKVVGILLGMLLVVMTIPVTGVTDNLYHDNGVKNIDSIHNNLSNDNSIFLSDSNKINPIWVKTWGRDNAEQDVRGITVDEDKGHIYLAGLTLSYGTQRVFLLKYAGNYGILYWNRIWSAEEIYQETAWTSPHAITFYDGHVYVVGSCSVASAPSDAFLLKYTRNGELITSMIFEKISGAYGVVARDGYLYISGDINFSAALWKFDLNGTKLWCKTWEPTEGAANSYGLVEHGNGVYLTGTTHVNKSGILTHEVLLLKYNISEPTSDLVLIDTWGGDSWDVGLGIKASNDYVYITGYTESFDKPSYVVVLKYSLQDETMEWYRLWGEEDRQYGLGITVVDDHLFICGDIHVAGQLLQSGCGNVAKALVLKYDVGGNLSWVKTWPSGDTWGVADSIMAYGGHLYVGGFTQGKSWDAFLLKCNFEGGKKIFNKPLFYCGFLIERLWLLPILSYYFGLKN
ncbi:MAG: hypothetical protein KKC68_01505 [Candidatus Thermoplasmatota archaeon]|nr:hypothetical protein [Candidatus Thermoplasmatota archaeon]MBU1940424.1 hypothetical protein [Candidatus Thermoplasmatota archaeon]